MNAAAATQTPITIGSEGLYYGSIQSRWGMTVKVQSERNGRLNVSTDVCVCWEGINVETCGQQGGHLHNVGIGSVQWFVRNEGPNVVR